MEEEGVENQRHLNVEIPENYFTVAPEALTVKASREKMTLVSRGQSNALEPKTEIYSKGLLKPLEHIFSCCRYVPSHHCSSDNHLHFIGDNATTVSIRVECNGFFGAPPHDVQL